MNRILINRTKLRRLLSGILAAALVFGLLPAGGPAAPARAAAPADIVYDFRSTGSQAPRPDGGSAFAHKLADGNNWELIEELCAIRVRSDQPSFLRFQSYGIQGAVGAANSAPDSDIAMRIRVDAAGYYQLNLQGLGHAAGATVGLYIDDVYAGEYSYKADATDLNWPAKDLRTLYLAEGEHVLIMRTIRAEVAYQFNQYPGVLTLKGVEAPPEQLYDFRSTGNQAPRPDGGSAFAHKLADGNNWELIEELCAVRIRDQYASRARFQSYGLQCAVGAVNAQPDSDVAMRIRVAEDGYYSLHMQGLGAPSGGVAAIYVDNVFGGEYSYYAAQTDVNWPAKAMRTLYLTAGEHVVLMRTMREEVKGQINQYPGTLSLKSAKEIPSVTELTAAADQAQPMPGDTVTISAAATMSDGAVVPVLANLEGETESALALVVTSSAPNVLEVQEDGSLLAKGAGSATVTVRLTDGGADCGVEATLSLTVPDVSSPLKSIEVHSSRGTELKGRVSTALSVTGTLENGLEADMSGAEVVYSVIQGDAVTVEGNRATVAKAGSATVQASATLNGVTVTGTIALTADPDAAAVPPDIIYDFRATDADGPRPDGGSAYEHKIADGRPWELVEALCATRIRSDQPNLARYQSYGLQCAVGAQNTPIESDVAMRLVVGNDGYYTVNLSGLGYVGGGVAALYLDGVYAGEYNYYSTTTILQQPAKDLRTLYLTEGEHHLTMRTVRTIAQYQYGQYPGVLTLKGVEAAPELTNLQATSDRQDISLQETAAVQATAYFSDGAEIPVRSNLDGAEENPMTLSFESLTPEILQVDAQGTVTPKSPGKGAVKVSAVVGGVEKSATADIYVYANSLEDVSVYLSEESIYVGKSTRLMISGSMTDGSTVPSESFTVEYSLGNPAVASVHEADGAYTVTGLAEGETSLTVTVTYGDFEPRTIALTVRVSEDRFAKLHFTAPSLYFKPGGEAQTISFTGELASGGEISLAGAQVYFESADAAVATVSDSGLVTPVGLGKTSVRVAVSLGGVTVEGEVRIVVSDGKAERTIYTDEKVSAARENIATYAWAREIRDNAVAAAEPYLDMDKMWNLVTTQELPRNWIVGFSGDPKSYYCRYPDCNTNLLNKYYSYPWLSDPLNDPWKIQCPECRRKFPSNDFRSFYELGIDEHGNFRYDKAKEENQKLVAAGQAGYLKNILYPELGEGWGVDDGYGYRTGNVFDNGVVEGHTYIAYYNAFGLYVTGYRHNPGMIPNALKALRDAYLIHRRGRGIRPRGRGAHRPGCRRVPGHGHLPLCAGRDPGDAQFPRRRKAGQDHRRHRGCDIHRAGLRGGLRRFLPSHGG